MIFIIILASKSPRRKELLDILGIEYKIIVSDADENAGNEKNIKAFVSSIAKRKAFEVYGKNKSDIIIAADTVAITKKRQILGKPQDQADAQKMLEELSGKRHTVMTALVVKSADREVCHVETTKVYFNKLNNGEIAAYVSSGEPMDKAGAYGIQEKGAKFIRKVKGDYFNVVGLPLSRLYNILSRDFKVL